ncbi:SGNH/GDSL hydrolase family protein [Pseudarthrobacter sulfonivorans]|uniref:SGNH/GDSL hydrolase family protein n=1 Tax=Pseudarthrobacter sulfonivorans TaxID=121292 RepID=UPI0028623FB1|nr:SGNH/GDSL hydrolase family protein [Pseudarthrobacter sulfonivorans]MDR6413717.1 acyl-CoA thioesterase-1 [Pseudarthrobacter sulfonivorans]
MRKPSALSRLAASGIAAGFLLGGCGLPPAPSGSSTVQAPGAGAPAVAAGPGAAGGAAGHYIPPGTDRLPAGTVLYNPASGRDEVVVPDMRHTALLIGDSQSEPADSWPRRALTAVGYKVHFCGRGGTGYVADNGHTGNFLDALLDGDWKLPYGTPALVVIQGGGNDATKGATDAEIVSNADSLIETLKDRYPGTEIAMIGTLARGAKHGGGRRTEVDALLGTVAARHDIPFISLGDWLTKYNLIVDLADDVHMDADGRGNMGRLLESRLRKLRLEGPPADELGPLEAAAQVPEN